MGHKLLGVEAGHKTWAGVPALGVLLASGEESGKMTGNGSKPKEDLDQRLQVESLAELFPLSHIQRKSLVGRPQVFTQRSRTGTYVCLGRGSRGTNGNGMRQEEVNRFNSSCFEDRRVVCGIDGLKQF